MDTSEEFLQLLDDRLKPLLDMQQQLITQNINLSGQLEEALKNNSTNPPQAPERNPQEPKVSTKKKTPYQKSSKIIIDKNAEGRIFLTGNTYNIKEGLKDKFGASWQGKPDSFWLLNENVDIEEVKDFCKQYEEIVVKCASWTS